MKKFILLTVAIPAIALAAPQWPHQANIVKPEPVALGLAGEAAPDITRYLLVRGPQDFELSPDGKTVAYLSDVTGEPQVWAVPATGGWPEQLSYGLGVDWIEASPRAGELLYGADTGGDERVSMNLLSLDGRRERVVVQKSPAFRTFGAFSKDGSQLAYSSTERNGTDFDIYLADVATGKTRRLYEGRYGFFVQSWQPGGPLLVVSETRGENGNNLYLLDSRTGALTTLFKPTRAAAYGSIAWAPDGSGFYLATDEGSDLSRVVYYDLGKRQLRTIAAPPHEVETVALSADGRHLAWTTIETGFNKLHLRDLRTGQDLPVPALPSGTLSIKFAEAAPVLGILANSPKAGREVHVLDLATNRLSLAVPTDAPGIDMASMVVPEPVSFKARDGTTLSGLLYMPRRPLGGSRPPVFLAVHGGPSAHATPGFDAETQYYAARGIAVLDFNYRGSTGQGRKFAELNDRELKVNEAGDIADAVAWLRASGRVDGDRIAIGGGSYGGYLTNLSLGTFPDMFVAGVSSVGVSDWVKALEGASPGLKASDQIEYGDISDPKVRAFFSQLSPINNARKIKTPLMVLHGANDPRDPVTESDHFVQAIRDAGGQVTYLRFPDEGHGISKLANRIHAYRRIAAFLEEQFTRKR
ncbi:prolyl oligopeptidase family serine peptidase [Allosphingosinicella sp.]|uniref:alpha/beta hydrolase family protein n=1 Tax=Allosphingosinicella sp. TaxID=2823234 RepID=UPI003D759E96